MARGDAVIWQGSSSGGSETDFRPAEGVEVCITSVFASSAGNYFPYFRRIDSNHSLTSYYNNEAYGIHSPLSAGSNTRNMKIFVTYTDYLRLVQSQTAYPWSWYVCGVQTK